MTLPIICSYSSNCLSVPLFPPKKRALDKKRDVFSGFICKAWKERRTRDRLISWSTAGGREPNPGHGDDHPLLKGKSDSLTDLFSPVSYVYELFMSG